MFITILVPMALLGPTWPKTAPKSKENKKNISKNSRSTALRVANMLNLAREDTEKKTNHHDASVAAQRYDLYKCAVQPVHHRFMESTCTEAA